MEGVQCICELGDALEMAPNLISHHLNKLRGVGLVDVERDTMDSRWICYSINRTALEKLNASFGAFLGPQRIQSRQPACGPRAADNCSTGKPPCLVGEKDGSI
jgi:ArsR family transcriptional regulator